VLNTELDRAKAAAPSQAAFVESYRAMANSRIDQELAARRCTVGTA
jgi:hypothetical protein